MIGKRLPAGKQWEAGALAEVPADYETVQYVAVPVANPTAGQPALLEYQAAGTGGGSLPTGVPGAILAADASGNWIAANILTDAVSGDVIVDAVTGDVILVPA